MINNEVTKHINEQINELKAELTYWKETAEHFNNQCKDLDTELHHLKAYNSYLEKALNNLNKTVDK